MYTQRLMAGVPHGPYEYLKRAVKAEGSMYVASTRDVVCCLESRGSIVECFAVIQLKQSDRNVGENQKGRPEYDIETQFRCFQFSMQFHQRSETLSVWLLDEHFDWSKVHLRARLGASKAEGLLIGFWSLQPTQNYGVADKQVHPVCLLV